MGIAAWLADSLTGATVKVNSDRALAVSPSQSSKTFNATLEVDNTAVEIVAAINGKVFCMTGIILTGNKNIDQNTDAVVDIYTSTDSASTTIVTTLFSLPIARSSQTVLTNIFIGSDRGHFINGKTSDDDVLVTILGFYID